MCGEYKINADELPERAETPPHLWGIYSRSPAQSKEARNTPTCVGNTLCLLGHCPVLWEHPHMCGESGL